MGLFLKHTENKNELPCCAAVVLAAGSSERMGFNKILAPLQGIPVVIRSVMAFERSSLISEIVIVTRKDCLETIADLCSTYGLKKVTKVVCGGATRAESGLIGVSAVSEKASLIAVHDGARPLVTEEVIARTIYAAAKYKAAIPAVPVNDTIKKVQPNGFIATTMNRSELFAVQTPQIFDADIIKGALTAAVSRGIQITDDCSAVELMGLKAFVTEGDRENLKLTTASDMILADTILKSRGC